MSIIDRREAYKDRSAASRKRLLRRYRDVIKQGVRDSIKKADGFSDVIKPGEERRPIKIERKSMDEPEFVYSQDRGDHEKIISGNPGYISGDKIDKPPSGKGGGSGRDADPNAEDGQDDFIFHLTADEFADILFEDLELPNLVKKSLIDPNSRELTPAGFTKTGPAGNLDVVRSFKNSLGRRIGLNRKGLNTRIADLQKKIDDLIAVLEQPNPVSEERAESLMFDLTSARNDLEALKRKRRAIPFIDEIDLRYRHNDWETKPSSSAVMFAVMDVSGSMGEHEKTLAKLFYLMLFLFLRRTYKHVDVVFIRHTTEAQEVDEKTFFHDTVNGGTIVSSGLKKVKEIVDKRYDLRNWNVYVAQASDGDNSHSDNPECKQVMEKDLLPLAQYMVYIEIHPEIHHEWYFSKSKTGLWTTYEEMLPNHENLAIREVRSRRDIYPVFRGLFERKN